MCVKGSEVRVEALLMRDSWAPNSKYTPSAEWRTKLMFIKLMTLACRVNAQLRLMLNELFN